MITVPIWPISIFAASVGAAFLIAWAVRVLLRWHAADQHLKLAIHASMQSLIKVCESITETQSREAEWMDAMSGHAAAVGVTLAKLHTSVSPILDHLESISKNTLPAPLKPAPEFPEFVAAVKLLASIETHMVEFIGGQRKVMRSLEGSAGTEDDDILDRARTIKEQYPEVTLEEAVSRAKQMIHYSGR